MSDLLYLSLLAILYLVVVAYLGFRGYKATRTTTDYLLAGRKTHPAIMALSYGATFISTSAIIGFGGAAAVFGMGLLWLTFLNIFVGIFIAFALFGKRTRTMGHRLDAHTFPELLGKRFQSRFIQGAAGAIIMIFMPLYGAAVLIGAARYIQTTFQINYDVAVTIYSIIVAAYVIAGGLKGVMYTDALQGSIMFVGMALLLVFAYGKLGGVVDAHTQLSQLPAVIETRYQEIQPEIRAIAPADVGDDQALFKWFAGKAGELKAAAAKSDEEKAAIFAAQPELKAVGELLKRNPALTNKLVIAKLSAAGFQGWTRLPRPGSNFFYVLITSIIMGVGIGVLAQPQLAVRFMTVKSSRELNRAMVIGGVFILMMTGVAFIVGNLSNAWFALPEHGGIIPLGFVKDGNIDLIMPAFINSALPKWFNLIFMLTLLSAAMSTQSSQLHAMGTSIGRDFFEQGLLGRTELKATVHITRIGIFLGIVATVLLAFKLPGSIIASATAVFFGLCASTFLPAYIGGLFWPRMTRAGAVASLCVGFGVSFFWLGFVQMISGKHPAVFAQMLFNKPTLLPGPVLGIQWRWVEALFVGLPLSSLTAIVVSLLTRPQSPAHLAQCFGGRSASSAAGPGVAVPAAGRK
ncbi:MAG: hypothetical protein Kow0059_01950 [Candidatus Sumerlaeia bacterium]